MSSDAWMGRFFSAVLFLVCLGNPLLATAGETKQAASSKKIAIIIDDLGHKYKAGVDTLNLEIPLSVAILPFTPHATKLAELAHNKDRDILLHLPMQPGKAMSLMTDKTLSIDMMREDFQSLIAEALDEVPHVQGVNNHMGSLFTQLPDQMHWLMQSLQEMSRERQQELFFIDSFTSQFSIAYQIADANNIATARRDVFLDRELEDSHMQAQIKKLKRIANKQGYAIAIGHPFPETLALLKQHIPQLKKQGYEFVSISSLLQSDALKTNIKKQLASLQQESQQAANKSAGKSKAIAAQP
ncbi:MAG: divergent polysaccharide deacetylase family protein [Gammaproteobacteria bacterium]|nr:divergent polysaccharide deacetylase family protein [Gammaproteobacteria bacterium]